MEVHSFLGFTNYCHKFIPKYIHIACPINQLVSGEEASKKKPLVEWTAECQQAFEQLKHLCSRTPVLAYTNYKKPFKLHTDASKNGLGAVLYQKQDNGMDHMIAYASQTLSKSERNYDAHKLEFLALKLSVTERFHEYLYIGHFEVITNNNPLTYILTTAKLSATGERWVTSLANYDFKIFYRSGKLNVEGDALSGIPWQNTQVDNMEPLIVKTMLQSKLVMDMDIPEMYPQLKVIQKSMVVDSSPKLACNDWIKEQSEDSDINFIVQLLKSNKLKKYMAREIDSSGMSSFKISEGPISEKWLTVSRSLIKEPSRTYSQFVLPKSFICQEILACHDDNGHLGMERTLGLLQERFFWPKMTDDVHMHMCTCDRCKRFKQPQERSEMQPILVSYLLELVHLDFLTLGGKVDDNRGVNILIVTEHFTKYAQAYVTPKQIPQWLLELCGRIFWYTVDGQRRFSLTKENHLRIIL